jgi:hypothetical protein
MAMTPEFKSKPAADPVRFACEPEGSMVVSKIELTDAVLELAQAAAAVANYCDHAEHTEALDLEDVRRAAETLRDIGLRLSCAAGRDPVELYADRLAMIEARNVFFSPLSLDGAAAAREARDWRALQMVQVDHDRCYHPDVIGLAKADQLRHYAFHLAKLVGATASVIKGEASYGDWLARRVPDMLLFGLKLSTVSAERLPEIEIQADLPAALPRAA